MHSQGRVIGSSQKIIYMHSPQVKLLFHDIIIKSFHHKFLYWFDSLCLYMIVPLFILEARVVIIGYVNLNHATVAICCNLHMYYSLLSQMFSVMYAGLGHFYQLQLTLATVELQSLPEIATSC